MTTALEHADVNAVQSGQGSHRAALPEGFLAFASFLLCVWATVLFADGGLQAKEWTPVLLTLTWASSGAVLALRRPQERTGALVLFVSLLAAIATVATAVVGRKTGSPNDIAEFARAMSVALLPAAALHLLLALPDGALPSQALRRTAVAGYVVAAAVGLLLGAASRLSRSGRSCLTRYWPQRSAVRDRTAAISRRRHPKGSACNGSGSRSSWRRRS